MKHQTANFHCRNHVSRTKANPEIRMSNVSPRSNWHPMSISTKITKLLNFISFHFLKKTFCCGAPCTSKSLKKAEYQYKLAA
jgi:hypothetical protein